MIRLRTRAVCTCQHAEIYCWWWQNPRALAPTMKPSRPPESSFHEAPLICLRRVPKWWLRIRSFSSRHAVLFCNTLSLSKRGNQLADVSVCTLEIPFTFADASFQPWWLTCSSVSWSPSWLAAGYTAPIGLPRTSVQWCRSSVRRKQIIQNRLSMCAWKPC